MPPMQDKDANSVADGVRSGAALRVTGFALFLALLLGLAAPAIAQLTEPIGLRLITDPGAPADTKYLKNHVKFQVHPETGWGFVPYRYWMNTHELKTSQYLDFLNSVACADSGQKLSRSTATTAALSLTRLNQRPTISNSFRAQ